MSRFRQLALAGALTLAVGATAACTAGADGPWDRYSFGDNGAYGDPHDVYRSDWWRPSDDNRGGWWRRSDDYRGGRRSDDYRGGWGGWDRDARDYRGQDWKERAYQRRESNGRPGDAQRLNNRLCHNGIPGDAPADCPD